MTVFGESHGKCVGVVIDGCPSGLKLSEEDFQRDLDKRIPKSMEVASKRRERDRIEVLSGLFRDHTTGAPICAIVGNKDVDDGPYLRMEFTPRPGHADYTAWKKYGGFNDFRGGGRFSGRVTVPYVIAGTIARKLLATLNVEVLAYTVELGGIAARRIELSKARSETYKSSVRCPDLNASGKMIDKLLEASRDGDSLGGVVEGVVLNLPPGIGEPIFDAVDADAAKLLFSIPGVKGVEFGAGFKASRLKGSENNDQIIVEGGEVSMATNNAGGVLGGITTGMPFVARIAFKPPSSIKLRQRTVDLRTMEEVDLEVIGRHDPCIVPKAVPVVEASLATVMADHLLRANLIPKILR